MSIATKLQAIAENEQKVFDAGKEAEHRAMWDVIQANGTRTNYAYAFYRGWNGNTFKPIYDIKPTNAQSMFQFQLSGANYSLKEVAEKQGISIDFSNCTEIQSAFHTNRIITEVGVIDARKASGLYAVFHGCTALKRIEKMIINETTTFNITFGTCSALEEIYFEGTIGKSIDLSACPLIVESAKSAINCLKNYSRTTSELTYSFKLASAVWTALDACGTAPDGSTSWKLYVFSLGWQT